MLYHQIRSAIQPGGADIAQGSIQASVCAWAHVIPAAVLRSRHRCVGICRNLYHSDARRIYVGVAVVVERRVDTISAAVAEPPIAVVKTKPEARIEERATDEVGIIPAPMVFM